MDGDKYLWWMKELRQVKISRGTMAHKVITLLNLDSSTVRVSPLREVPLISRFKEMLAGESFSLLVKY